MNDSSSFASSDGLSFILEESSDDEHISKYVLDNDTDKRALELIMKLRQVREEKRAFELGMIMKACIILHNMIVEDERDSYDLAFEYDDVEDSILVPIVRQDTHLCYAVYLCRVVQIRDPELHARLQSDLKQEIWRRHTARQESQP